MTSSCACQRQCCHCGQAVTVAPRRAAWDRYVALWVFVTFIGINVAVAYTLPESWGAWRWLPTLVAWWAVTCGPVLAYRYRVRRRAAKSAAAIAAYRNIRPSGQSEVRRG